MMVGHVKDLQNCLRSVMDLLQTITDRFADEKTAQRIGLLTVFLTRKPFLCQSIADPVRSGNVFRDICWGGSIKDETDATRTSSMGLRTIRTFTDELQMRYGRAMDTKVHVDFKEKSNSLIFL